MQGFLVEFIEMVTFKFGLEGEGATCVVFRRNIFQYFVHYWLVQRPYVRSVPSMFKKTNV